MSAFAVFEQLSMQHCFDWHDKNAKALYVSRLGVHPDYARQGMGLFTLKIVADIAKSWGVNWVRLLVAVENTPAIGLYHKAGFEQAAGSTNEYFDSLKRVVTELGFEKRI